MLLGSVVCVRVLCTHMSVELTWLVDLAEMCVCVCVCVPCPHTSVTLASASRLGQWGVCVFLVPIRQLHWPRLVDLGSGVCVCVHCPHSSVTLASASRLGQWGVCVCSLSPFVSYTGLG